MLSRMFLAFLFTISVLSLGFPGTGGMAAIAIVVVGSGIWDRLEDIRKAIEASPPSMSPERPEATATAPRRRVQFDRT